MFKGYLEFGDGGELVNVERSEAYIANLAPGMPFHPQGNLGNLALANNEPPYRSPLLDRAPWANPLDPVTNDFYGLYPLDVLGIGDSTFAASTTESVENGGSTQRGRNSTRDIKVSGLLIGRTELATESGLTWLRSMLQDVECADQCGGGYLRYYLADPDICRIAWGRELPDVSESVSFGTVTGPSGLLDVRWTKNDVDPSMPSRTLWTGVAGEGAEIRFGARDFDGNILAADQIIPLRKNYAINGTFFAGMDGWVGTGGSTPVDDGFGTAAFGTAPLGRPSAVVWRYAGGVNDGGYIEVLRPIVIGTPTNYGAGNYGAGPFGSETVATLTSQAWATPPGPVTVSLAMRSSDAGLTTLQILDASTGGIAASVSLEPTEDWQRFSLTGFTDGTRVRVITDRALDVDEVLAESGEVLRDYFDGSQQVDGYTTSWADAPYTSVSTRSYDADWETLWDSSDYLPFMEVLGGTVQNVRLTWFYRDPFDVERQLVPYERTLHNVAVTQGPVVLNRIDNTKTTGGYFIQVEMLFTAGNPFSYGPPRQISLDYVETKEIVDPLPNIQPTDDWLYDPNALVPSSPPGSPDIVADAIDASITKWQRYYFAIPAEEVADWASSVPLMTISSHAKAARQIRVRFHPNPFRYAPNTIDPMSYCADFLVSYLPSVTSLQMNGMVQTSTATKAGVATVPADSILYGSDGGPMTWPRLSCGIPYVLTVDVPSPADYDLFDLTLALSREE